MSKYYSYATDAFDEFSTTLKQLKKYGLNKTYVDGSVIANRLPSISKGAGTLIDILPVL